MRTRRLKVEGVGAVYHCISRIVGGEFLLEGEREKEVLRNQIWKVADFCGVEVLTYCIMSNHLHVLVRTPDQWTLRRIPNNELVRRAKRIYSKEKAGNFELALTHPENEVRELARSQLLSRMGDVSQYMKELKQRFSIWYNKSHDRFGTLWAERFKSVLIEDEPMALSTVAAYIELNPVRAGIVDDPSLYRFCGYAEAMGGFTPARKGISSLFGKKEQWAMASSWYRVAIFGKGQSLDASRPRTAVNAEKAAQVMSEGGKISSEEALRCRIRYFSDGVILGSKEFVQQHFERHRQLFGIKRRDGPRRLRGSPWSSLRCARGLRKNAFG
ncbi:transposase [Pelagicoccus sp. SDUM812005]|uniref:transposase n=1 Tax=Pelagicoccus sp. SDUM812005 TaxID=3041257 RepID=UPI00280E51CC|nr:transposase [Pelagicoccus sp. SDUM812005]MDQ8181279.1 transposase [Pelagicoccus sp. SDUM812005]